MNIHPSILIIEDNISSLKLITNLLDKADEKYNYLIAFDGHSGYKVATKESENIDLILMDWEMPKLNGIQATKLLKENPLTTEIPIIMVTNLTASSNLNKALAIGASDYIGKPIDHQILLSRVRTAILAKRKTLKTKILFLGANPINTSFLRLGEEIREISNSLRSSKLREKFIIVQEWAVTINTMLRALQEEKPSIVHFSGHGISGDEKELRHLMTNRDININNKRIEGIVLENDHGKINFVSSDILSEIFKSCNAHIKCVILNSCYSSIQAKAINSHIPYVIGMNQRIKDNSSIIFSRAFYMALGAGRSIEDSFHIGKIELEAIAENDASIPELYSLT